MISKLVCIYHSTKLIARIHLVVSALEMFRFTFVVLQSWGTKFDLCWPPVSARHRQAGHIKEFLYRRFAVWLPMDGAPAIVASFVEESIQNREFIPNESERYHHLLST